MLKAIDAARFFIYLMQDEENDLSNLKLNKLLYYAQGCHLKRTGKPLFCDNIEAWQHGPVVADIYHAYKSFGNRPINEFEGEFDSSDFDEFEMQTLLDTAREFGKYSASALREMTHQPNTPWSLYFKEGKRNIVIPNETIKSYFDNSVSIGHFEPDFSEEDEIGYRDDEGYLVLPADYED